MKLLTDGGHEHDDETCEHGDVISDPTETDTLQVILTFIRIKSGWKHQGFCSFITNKTHVCAGLYLHFRRND